jgi:MFS family permease
LREYNRFDQNLKQTIASWHPAAPACCEPAMNHTHQSPTSPAARDGACQHATPDKGILRRARWATRAQFLTLGMLAGVWGVHIPTVKSVYALNEAHLSLVLLAVALGAVVALLWAGRLISAAGPRRTAQFAAVPMGCFIALSLHWPSLPMLLLSMVCMGSAMSLFDVAINTEGSTLESAGRSPIMGNLHGHFSVGGMAGAVLAALLLHAGLSAPWQLGLIGVAAVLWTISTAQGMLPAHPMPVGSTHGSASAFQWPGGTLLLLGLLAFAGMSAEGAMYDWSVLFLQQEVGMPQAQAAWGYAAFSAAMAATRFAGDDLRRRHSEAALLQAGAWLCALSMSLVLVTGHPWVALLGYACTGAGLAMVVPILYNAAGQVPGKQRGSAIATVSAIGYTGFLLGPPVVGSLAHTTSLRWALALMVPMTLLLAFGARHVPSHPHQSPG